MVDVAKEILQHVEDNKPEIERQLSEGVGAPVTITTNLGSSGRRGRVKNTRTTLDSIKVKPDEKGPITTITLRARLSQEELADLYGFFLLEEGALDVTLESKQPVLA